MKLGSFRELLLKKCEDDSLKGLIKFAKEDIIAELVFESLEKMADAKHKGDSANMALRNFGSEMDSETHPDMIRDALGHHASRYKAAVGANRQDLANAHAKQFYSIINTSHLAQKHSDGKLDVNAVSPTPWERHSKLNQYDDDSAMVQAGKRKSGQFVTDTKGWNYKGKDYSFLQKAPHGSQVKEIRRHGHDDAYPMEQTRVNGKYIHIDDVDSNDLKGYEGHEFDNHPIMTHGKQSAGKRTPEDDQKYDTEAMAFDDSKHMDKYFDRHDAMREDDPDKYDARGSKASDPIHKKTDQPLDLTPQEGNLKPKAEAKPDMSKDDFMSSITNSKDIPDDLKARILARFKDEK